MINYLKPYIGKYVNLRTKSATYENVFISEINNEVVIIIITTPAVHTTISIFIDINTVVSFSIENSFLDETHLKYIEKFNIQQTFK